MIQDVYLDHSTFAEPPSRFEAGTPGIAEAIGLGVACDYLTGIGMDEVHAYEEELGGYLHQQVCCNTCCLSEVIDEHHAVIDVHSVVACL